MDFESTILVGETVEEVTHLVAFVLPIEQTLPLSALPYCGQVIFRDEWIDAKIDSWPSIRDYEH